MQANTPSDDFSKILTQYWQISLVVGYSALYGKVVALLRCVVVETTIGSPRDVTQDQLDDASTQRFTAKDTSSLNWTWCRSRTAEMRELWRGSSRHWAESTKKKHTLPQHTGVHRLRPPFLRRRVPNRASAASRRARGRRNYRGG